MRVLALLFVASLTAFAQMSDTPPSSNSMSARKQSAVSRSAEYIFLNADIYTGTSPVRAQALAVRDGRILAIGTTEEVSRLKDDKTRVIDLGGHFVMPGFNDAHLHLAGGGFEKLNVDLTGSRSLKEMQARIAQRAGEARPGEWIIGHGWDHTMWQAQHLPTRQDIDAVTGEHPAYFVRIDGHIAVANSAALSLAAISRATKDPSGSEIDRDTSGNPTGILRESALELVTSRIPEPSPEMRRRAIELALQDAARWGITSVQDNSSWEDFLVYEDLEREGKLTVRITEWLPFQESVARLQEHRAHHPQTDAMLHTGMLKGFLDGSLGSRTAAMLAPYSDDPGKRGLPQFDPSKLNPMAEERSAAGFQLGFHAIGDAAVRMALNAFADAETYAREHNSTGTAPDFRFRVEHAQVLAPPDFARFRELGVVASMQPNHLLTDMNWAIARLGQERAKHSYAWKEFQDNGIRLAFGTDYPVEPITPFRGLYAAVTRANEAGTKTYFPEQKLTIGQAIAAYTTGAAYAEFAEKDKGTLSPGMLADFVVLDRDITKVDPSSLLKTQVLRTVVGGKTVFEAAK